MGISDTPRHLIGAALVLVALVLAAPALATTFTSRNLDKKIPEIGMVKSKIEVTQGGDISDVNLKVRLSHTYTCDLIVGVQSPEGEFIELSDQYCSGSNKHFGTGDKACSGTPTVFDDEAMIAISSGANPYAGSFQPEEALSELDTGPAKGTWTLYVFDINQDDDGRLHCWKLDIHTA